MVAAYERDKERWIKSKNTEDLEFVTASMGMINIWDKKLFHHRYKKIDEQNRLFDKKFKEEKKIYE